MVPGWNGRNLSTQYEADGEPAVVNGTPGQGYQQSCGPNVTTTYCGNYANGGQGPNGSSDDGVACGTTMSNNYHIHVFVGLYVNGTEVALPPAAGAVRPQLDANGDFVGNGTDFYPCLYETHTHDSTGVVHVESVNGGVVETVPNDSKFILGQFFTVWGATLSWGGIEGSLGQVGPYSGPMEVFTSGAQYRGDGTPGAPVTAESTLQTYAGDPNQIPLWSHEVIWFLIGPNYPSQLPGISFDEQF